MFTSKFHDGPVLDREPVPGDQSPWGKIQMTRPVAEGVTFVSCAGHGGCHLTPDALARMPERARSTDGWYEEDCEALLPVHFLQINNSNPDIVAAIQYWYPDIDTELAPSS